MLAVLGIFILGPLGGVTASYMNFSIGFFVGGQVLAGILGSTVTWATGPRASTAPTTCRRRRLGGRHGRHGRADPGHGVDGPAPTAGCGS
jgi:hypothetical protein